MTALLSRPVKHLWWREQPPHTCNLNGVMTLLVLAAANKMAPPGCNCQHCAPPYACGPADTVGCSTAYASNFTLKRRSVDDTDMIQRRSHQDGGVSFASLVLRIACSTLQALSSLSRDECSQVQGRLLRTCHVMCADALWCGTMTSSHGRLFPQA